MSTLMLKTNENTIRVFSSVSNNDENWKELTQKLVYLKKIEGKYRNLTRDFLSVPMFLEGAYNKIKSKKKNMISRIDKETLSRISKQWFIETTEKIKMGRFNVKPYRTVSIFKKSGREKKLILGNPKDKIVQEGIRTLLEYIYEHKENVFQDTSHGFRTGRSCHTALKSIKFNWTSIPWYIEFDIKKAFDFVNRNKLMKLLESMYQDSKLSGIIRRMFNVKTLTLEGILMITKEEAPQGNLLSPLLCNIYLDELDKEMKKLTKKYEKGVRATSNSEFNKIVKISDKEKENLDQAALEQLKRVRRRKAWTKGITPTILDENFIRVKYVRYANDFIVGVRGPKILALKIKKEITTFLKSELYLTVNEEKTRLTHTYYEKAKFLGTEINNIRNENLPYRNSRRIENIKRKRAGLLSKYDALEKAKLKKWREEVINKVFEVTRGRKISLDIKEKLHAALVEVMVYLKTKKKKVGLRVIIREFTERTLKFLDSSGGKFQEVIRYLAEKKSCKFKTSSINQDVVKIIDAIDIQKYIYEQMTHFENYDDESKPYDFGEKIPKSKYIYDVESAEKLKDIKYLPLKLILEPHIKKQLDKNRTNHKNRIQKINWMIILEWLRELQNRKLNKVLQTKVPLKWRTLIQESFENSTRHLGLPPQIRASMEKIYNQLEFIGFINNKKRPLHLKIITSAPDYDIILYYRSVASGLLSYFRFVDNLDNIKGIINWTLRKSLIKTLKRKHKMSHKKFINRFGKNITSVNHKGNTINYYTWDELSVIKKGFLVNSSNNHSEILNKKYLTLSNLVLNKKYSSVKECNDIDIEIHHIC